MAQGLVEYIQRLLKQGYDAGVIRSTLLNAGYSPHDVDVAMRVAGGQKRKPTVLIVVFASLLIVAGIVWLVMTLLVPEPIEVGVGVSLFSSKIAPKDALVMTIDVRSSVPATGLLDVRVRSAQKEVFAKTESLRVDGIKKIPYSITLKDAQKGQYRVEVVFSAQGIRRSAFATFDVVEQVAVPSESIVEQQVPFAQDLAKACPRGCDDGAFCTQDACIDGKCVHTPMTPCCGNKVCEAGEQQSCAIDCVQSEISPKERAVQVAKANVVEATRLCDTLGSQVYVDGCLRDVADAAGDVTVCDQIASGETRDVCIMRFVDGSNAALCEKISNKYVKNSCYNIVALKQI